MGDSGNVSLLYRLNKIAVHRIAFCCPTSFGLSDCETDWQHILATSPTDCWRWSVTNTSVGRNGEFCVTAGIPHYQLLTELAMSIENQLCYDFLPTPKKTNNKVSKYRIFLLSVTNAHKRTVT